MSTNKPKIHEARNLFHDESSDETERDPHCERHDDHSSNINYELETRLDALSEEKFSVRSSRRTSGSLDLSDTSRLFRAVPARVVIGVMMFLACCVNYITRVNISIIIIAMVTPNSTVTSMKSECDAINNNTNSVYTKESDLDGSRKWKQHDSLDTFNWTEQEQAYILSSYFWGYTLTSFIGVTMVEAVSSRLLVLCITLVCGVGDLLSPHAAHLHYMALAIVRFLEGIATGMLYPALNKLLVHWAPPDERGIFVSSLIGGAIGIVFAWTLIGFFIERFGWNYAFYITGTIVLLWCLLWWFLVYDSPVVHPRISDAEREYITNAIGDKLEHSLKKKPLPPFRRIFTSFPVLALTLVSFGNGWGLYFLMTAAPKYVSNALGFNLSSSGILASLPYLARMVFSLVFGVIGDRIVRSNWMSTISIRKFFCLFSHIIPGLMLAALGFTGCAPILSVCLITFALGFNGSVIVTALANHMDLAPNFSGSLYSIANGFTNIAGFLTPLVTAHFTKNGNSLIEWRPVFITGASIYIGTAVYFIFFGTADTQPWNFFVTSLE